MPPTREMQLKGAEWWAADGRVARLAELWASGMTTPRIALELGDGCTKNMVISKARRLGLDPRVEAKLPAPPRHSALMDLGPENCRWPIGHPGEPGFRFCGEQAPIGKPYCPTHTARAYDNKSHKPTGGL